MYRSYTALVSQIAFASLCWTQFITPPTDLTNVTGYAGIQVRYKEVPHGICELNNTVKSYSGYVDVAPNQHIFFWFFESRNNPSTDPLTMWISGGPGSTSMSELFINHGPCKIDRNINPVNNPYSWTANSNMIFVDQPVEVGFSYTIPIPAYQDESDPTVTTIIGLPDNSCPDYAGDTCGTYGLQDITLTANTTQAGADNIWKTLQGFMGAFPQYSKNGFNLATESYGGHYGPVYTQYILDQNNRNITNATKINFETLIIGNGWFDPVLQNIAYYNYTVSPGDPYDLNVFTSSQAAQLYNNIFGPGNCLDQVKQCNALKRADVCNQADNFCTDEIDNLFGGISNRDQTDIRELDPDPLPEDYFYDYLGDTDILKAIGAFTLLSDYPLATVQAFITTGDDSLVDGTVSYLRDILAQNISVMLYAGDADFECNWIGGLMVAEELHVPGFADAGFTNVSTPDGIVHAQVRQAGAFSYVRVFEAGHEVPYYQPEVTQQMFARAAQGRDIATGKTRIAASPGYRTAGPAFSDYREGNRTVQYKRLPAGAEYNITTNEPYVPRKKKTGKRMQGRVRAGRKGRSGRK